MHWTAYVKTACLALLSLVLVVSILSFPKQAFEASMRGLSIWWEVVFPALLPFFITAELMIGFGVVHFLGILLEPLMRPLFRVPGVGGFVISMSIASGYPMGAKLTVRLREENLISRAEGERLVSVASTSGPLFMIGAVAVGFFHDVRLGLIIALAHYLASLCVGLSMRFYQQNEPKLAARDSFLSRSNHHLLYRALQAMHRARVKDKRPIGQLLGDAVTSSIQTLLLIGGFIILFSVILNILNIIGLTKLMGQLIMLLLTPVGVDPSLIQALLAGLFEITLGSQLASQAGPEIPLVHKVAAASAIIAWSGLSVHAQVASLLAKTDIRYTTYLVSRLLHALYASLWTYVLWKPLLPTLAHFSWPVLAQGDFSPEEQWSQSQFFMTSSMIALAIALLSLLFLFTASRRVKNNQV